MLVELFNKVVMPQMRIWFGVQKGLTPDGRAKHWNESMDNVEAFERELSSRGSAFFAGDQPGWLDYMIWPWFERIDSYSLIFKVREAIKVEKKKKCDICHTFLRGGAGSEVFVTLFILCLEWPNSSRNAKKNFSPL